MKASLALIVLLATPAAADGIDPAVPVACLADARDAMRGGATVGDGLAACVGNAARACEDRISAPTTLDMNICRKAEATWWDERLNEVYADLRRLVVARDAGRMPEAGAVRADALRDMQRAWIRWRDAACAFEAGEFAGGSLAGTVRVTCTMQRTAQQVLWLAGELDRMERQ